MTREARRWWKNYRRYLRSQEWRQVSRAARARDKFRCQLCGGRGTRSNPLQADHVSYTAYNLTAKTPLSDVRTLCRNCHQKVTGRQFPRSRRPKLKVVAWLVVIGLLALCATRI